MPGRTSDAGNSLEPDPYLLTDYATKHIQERVIGLSDSASGAGMFDIDGISRQITLSILTLLIATFGGSITARIFAARSDHS
jgi:hypothetical protein